MPTEAIGITLKRLRQARGISQNHLAQLAKVDRSYISQIEGGRTVSMRLNTAKALAHGLGVPVSALVDRGEEPPPRSIPEMFEELRRRYEQLIVAEVPYRGRVPESEPAQRDRENIAEYVVVPELEGKEEVDVYAVESGDNALKEGGIQAGDLVIITPGSEARDGEGFYLIRCDGDRLLRKIVREGMQMNVSPSLQKGDDGDRSFEVLGRVVLSGQWRHHL